MSFSIGMVGLPNVGKSTLFNAITKSEAKASNYPFCTIDPNRARVSVTDPRLGDLAKIHRSDKTVLTSIEFVDIAGLVAGASEGEGLGNQFLSHIREVNAIIHVVRLFRDPAIIREQVLSPIKDLDIIQTELFLADLKLVEKRWDAVQKEAKRSEEAKKQVELLGKIKQLILEERLLSLEPWKEEEIKWIKSLNLLTIKPMILVVNIDENDIVNFKDNDLFKELEKYSEQQKLPLIPLCAHIELELTRLDDEKMFHEYKALVGMKESGLPEMIKNCYQTLDLITFITTGEMETKAWTVKRGTYAPQAAGVIHSDMELGFIKLEVVSSEVLIELGSMDECRKKGKVRIEGKSYPIQDGDVCHFLFRS